MESARIFISYARNSNQDYKFLQLLKRSLVSLESYGFIDIWYGSMEKTLEDEEHRILTHLADDDIFLILVSQDYLNSEYCAYYELGCIRERHDDGSAIAIPLIVSTCTWKSNNLLADLQPLPKDERPINTSSNLASRRDAILTEVAEDIAQVVYELLDEPYPDLPPLVARGKLHFEDKIVQEWLAKDMVPLRTSLQPNRRSPVSISLAAPHKEQLMWMPSANIQRSSVTSSAKQPKAGATKGKKKQEEQYLLADEAAVSSVRPQLRTKGGREVPVSISFRELFYNWLKLTKFEYRACFRTELFWFVIIACFFDVGYLLYVSGGLKMPLIIPIFLFILLVTGIFNASKLLGFLLAAIYGIFWGKVFQLLYSWSSLTALILGGCILLFHYFLFRDHPWLYVKRRKRKWWRFW